MKPIFVLVPFLLGVAVDVGAEPFAPSLCSQQEQVIFSCGAQKGKVISLCGSANLGPDRGYLQYRFGALGKPVEMTWPPALEHPSGQFLSGTLAFAGGGGAYLKFSNGGYAYTVFTGTGRGWEKEGVVVDRAGERLTYLACVGPWTSELGPDLFERIEVPEDPEQYDFEVP